MPQTPNSSAPTRHETDCRIITAMVAHCYGVAPGIVTDRCAVHDGKSLKARTVAIAVCAQLRRERDAILQVFGYRPDEGAIIEAHAQAVRELERDDPNFRWTYDWALQSCRRSIEEPKNYTAEPMEDASPVEFGRAA